MDGFTWLILSWLVVGVLCYFTITKLGQPSTVGNKESPKASLASKMEIVIDANSASGWINEIIAWMTQNYRETPELLLCWINSLNDAAKKISSARCEILFEAFGNNSGIADHPPQISKLLIERGPRDHLIVQANVDIREMILKLVSSQRVNNHLVVSNFTATISDLNGRVEARFACIANQFHMMACFCERPELNIQLINNDSSNSVIAMNTTTAVVEEMISKCIMSAVLNTTIVLNSKSALPCLQLPSAYLSSSTSSRRQQQIVEEIMRNINQSAQVDNQTARISSIPNRMRVKVIRAQRLGHDREVNEPYVVIEMDEPPQKYASSKGASISPYWEETFDFILTTASEEVLFEIYDHKPVDGSGSQTTVADDAINQRFLGLAIVSLEEIRRSVESVHTLRLQGRPYRRDVISGTLTTQFDFYNDSNLQITGKEFNSLMIRNDVDEFHETVSSTRRPLYDPIDNFGGRDVIPTKTSTVIVKKVTREAAMCHFPGKRAMCDDDNDLSRDFYAQTAHGIDDVQPMLASKRSLTLASSNASIPFNDVPIEQSTFLKTSGGEENKKTETSNHYKTTNSNQQSPKRIDLESNVKQSKHILRRPVAQKIPESEISAAKRREENSPKNAMKFRDGEQMDSKLSPIPTISNQQYVLLQDTIQKESSYEIPGSRSRGREKKNQTSADSKEREGSFFSELRERLSGRNRKSKKWRSKSYDLEDYGLEGSVSLPPSREQSRQTRYSEVESGSQNRGSASIGVTSEKSSKSLYMQSTLVLEITERNREKRHYLIPPHLLDQPLAHKLLKYGKKMHIYNEHVFVAVKIERGTTCDVCNRRIGQSFYKQAYQCRDCKMVCHKRCHYKFDTFCQSSTVSKLNIISDVDWSHFLATFGDENNEYISETGI